MYYKKISKHDIEYTSESLWKKAERNISGLIVERYELLPRWREVIDNSP